MAQRRQYKAGRHPLPFFYRQLEISQDKNNPPNKQEFQVYLLIYRVHKIPEH